MKNEIAVIGLWIALILASLMGCTTNVVSDVYVDQNLNQLVVKRCLLENADVWPETCEVRQYPLK